MLRLLIAISLFGLSRVDAEPFLDALDIFYCGWGACRDISKVSSVFFVGTQYGYVIDQIHARSSCRICIFYLPLELVSGTRGMVTSRMPAHSSLIAFC